MTIPPEPNPGLQIFGLVAGSLGGLAGAVWLSVAHPHFRPWLVLMFAVATLCFAVVERVRSAGMAGGRARSRTLAVFGLASVSYALAATVGGTFLNAFTVVLFAAFLVCAVRGRRVEMEHLPQAYGRGP